MVLAVCLRKSSEALLCQPDSCHLLVGLNVSNQFMAKGCNPIHHIHVDCTGGDEQTSVLISHSRMLSSQLISAHPARANRAIQLGVHQA